GARRLRGAPGEPTSGPLHSINDHLAAVPPAQLAVEVADAIGEPQFYRLLSAPELAAEELFFRRQQAAFAAAADLFLEGFMQLFQHSAKVKHILLLPRLEGVEQGFARTGGFNASFHAQTLEQGREAEAGRDDADRP